MVAPVARSAPVSLGNAAPPAESTLRSSCRPQAAAAEATAIVTSATRVARRVQLALFIVLSPSDSAERGAGCVPGAGARRAFRLPPGPTAREIAPMLEVRTYGFEG